MIKLDKRIRVQVFSPDKSNYRQLEISWRRLLFYALVLSVMMMGLLTTGLFLIADVFNVADASTLRAESETVHQKIVSMEDRYARLSEDLAILNEAKAEEAIRQPADLVSSLVPEENNPVYAIVDDVATRSESLLNGGGFKPNDRISSLIDDLERKLDSSLQEQRHIEERFADTSGGLENIPTIRPLLSGRVSDLFGKREDPFHKRARHHGGIDIAAKRGTEVFAPADGVVEIVRTKYRLNVGYGRYVRIRHGGGIKTLYGHLDKVLVKSGQKVNRWDVIGLVGDTGRATGPHLHYEILVKGKRIDPMEYILN